MIVYVDAAASGSGNGTSWTNAYTDLQAALTQSNATEVWVTAGTYKPAEPGGDRTTAFDLSNDMRIAGGFAGGEARFVERDYQANLTILSGDLNGDDGPDWTNREDNSVHVVTARGIYAKPTAVLDGVVVTAGNANHALPNDRGGGLYSTNASPTILNCKFHGNFAEYGGGGVYNDGYQRAIIPLTLTNCTFTQNLAGHSGGGLYNVDAGGALVVNCAFHGNSAEYGGGVYNAGCTPTIVNCIFTGNSSSYYGGALANRWSSDTILTNCTLIGNTTGTDGGGIYNYGGGSSPSTITITSCILWGNSDRGGTNQSAQVDQLIDGLYLNYNCVQGWNGYLGGEGNFDDDPFFVDADGEDDVIGTEDDHLHLQAGSPCVDAGDSTAVPSDITTDMAGQLRLADHPATPDTGQAADGGPIVDLGAYELVDCNLNGIRDDEDIASGTSSDCNDSGTPDECDLAQGASEDCTGNLIPDECEVAPDCNGNTVADHNDVCLGQSEDCNYNEVPDECEPDEDCNGNGTRDICDIGSGLSRDCNVNSIPDECDISSGSSEDLDGNSIPDECEKTPAPEPGSPSCGDATDCMEAWAGADCVAGACYVPKNRYLSIDPAANEYEVAYQVELTEAVDYPTAVGKTWWVGEPLCYDYPNGHVVLPTPSTCEGAERFGWVSTLSPAVVTRAWTEAPLHITGCGIVPAVSYRIRASADGGGSFSAPLEINTVHRPEGDTQSWGDITGGPVPGTPGWWLPPERATNFADVGNAIRTFENRTEDTGQPPRVWVDLETNQVINLGDIQFVITAFEGTPYAEIEDLDYIGWHPADCP